MLNVLRKKERPVVVPTDHPPDSETRGQEVETGPDPGGGHFLQELVEEATASDVETGPDPGGGQDLVKEQVTASEADRGPDPGDRGQWLQHLLEEQVKASEVDRGPDPGGGQAVNAGDETKPLECDIC